MVPGSRRTWPRSGAVDARALSGTRSGQPGRSRSGAGVAGAGAGTGGGGGARRLGGAAASEDRGACTSGGWKLNTSTSDDPEPGSGSADRLSLAQDAHEHAQSLVAIGNHAEARRWMERAYRLLPADDMLALALASAWLGVDDARACEIFTRLAMRYASREAWTGLAVSRRNLGDLKGAAEAVSRALATLVPDAMLTGVAD